MERKDTKPKVQKVAALLEMPLVERIDRERRAKGNCSRAVIIRMALLDRYRDVATPEVA